MRERSYGSVVRKWNGTQTRCSSSGCSSGGVATGGQVGGLTVSVVVSSSGTDNAHCDFPSHVSLSKGGFTTKLNCGKNRATCLQQRLTLAS